MRVARFTQYVNRVHIYVCQLVYFLLLFKVFVAQKSQVPFQPNHLHILPCIERLTRCLDLCGGLMRFTELKQYYRLLIYESHTKIYIFMVPISRICILLCLTRVQMFYITIKSKI